MKNLSVPVHLADRGGNYLQLLTKFEADHNLFPSSFWVTCQLQFLLVYCMGVAPFMARSPTEQEVNTCLVEWWEVTVLFESVRFINYNNCSNSIIYSHFPSERMEKEHSERKFVFQIIFYGETASYLESATNPPNEGSMFHHFCGVFRRRGSSPIHLQFTKLEVAKIEAYISPRFFFVWETSTMIWFQMSVYWKLTRIAGLISPRISGVTCSGFCNDYLEIVSHLGIRRSPHLLKDPFLLSNFFRTSPTSNPLYRLKFHKYFIKLCANQI